MLAFIAPKLDKQAASLVTGAGYQALKDADQCQKMHQRVTTHCNAVSCSFVLETSLFVHKCLLASASATDREASVGLLRQSYGVTGLSVVLRKS